MRLLLSFFGIRIPFKKVTGGPIRKFSYSQRLEFVPWFFTLTTIIATLVYPIILIVYFDFSPNFNEVIKENKNPELSNLSAKYKSINDTIVDIRIKKNIEEGLFHPVRIKATVTKINIEELSNYKIYVTYYFIYKNKKYENTVLHGSGNLSVGKDIDVEFDPNNPQNSREVNWYNENVAKKSHLKKNESADIIVTPTELESEEQSSTHSALEGVFYFLIPAILFCVWLYVFISFSKGNKLYTYASVGSLSMSQINSIQIKSNDDSSTYFYSISYEDSIQNTNQTIIEVFDNYELTNETKEGDIKYVLYLPYDLNEVLFLKSLPQPIIQLIMKEIGP